MATENRGVPAAGTARDPGDRLLRGPATSPTVIRLNGEVLDRAPGLLDYDQAAAYLGTTPRHVRHLWQTRQIPAIKLGKKLVRFSPEDLADWVAAHRVEAVG